MAFYEIPLGPSQRVMTIAIGSATYALRFSYADTPEGGWFMDISDAVGVPIACGIPLVTGADLLAQYGYLGLGFRLWVTTDGDPTAVPTYDNLGVTSHVFVEM